MADAEDPIKQRLAREFVRRKVWNVAIQTKSIIRTSA